MMGTVSQRRPLFAVISIVFLIQIVIGLVVGSAAFTNGSPIANAGTVAPDEASPDGHPVVSRSSTEGLVAEVAPATSSMATDSGHSAAVGAGSETQHTEQPGRYGQVDPLEAHGKTDVTSTATAATPDADTPRLTTLQAMSNGASDGGASTTLTSTDISVSDTSLEVAGPALSGRDATITPRAAPRHVESTVAPGTGPVQLFPVVGGGPFSSSFGAPRAGGERSHMGNDIFAAKLTPVIAVADGTVVGAPKGPGETCCYLKVRHDDGGVSVYLHLNNDTPGTDDGLGWGLAEGIAKGTRVTAGQVIAFVGDSGNAEETRPHLHFEYRPDGSNAVDPYQMLVAAPVMEVIGTTTVLAQPDVTTLPFTGGSAGRMTAIALSLIVAGAAVLSSSKGTRRV